MGFECLGGPCLSPSPLSKCFPDGSPYTRPPEVEAVLGRIIDLGREQVVRALDVRRTDHPDHIPSECLVHLLRRTRLDNRDDYFERLYKCLMDRIDRVLPRVEHDMGDRVGVDLSRARIRDQVRDRFQELLLRDRREPGDGLDFFEVRFAAGIAKLRATAKERIWREAGREEPLAPADGTGEMSPRIERAAGSLDRPRTEIWDDPSYRSRLDAAIDALPPEQSRTITMLRAGVPIDSNDPEEVTIRKRMDCAEKTVRNRRDAAIRTLRRALGLEDEA